MEVEAAYYHFWRVLPVRHMLERPLDHGSDPAASRHRQEHPRYDVRGGLQALGRITNITVSPAGVNQPPRLLNYLTFPYLYVREAVLASTAVPILFPPVMLMTRDEVGERVPYMPMLRWNDGSLKSDLPMLRMRRLHNVNHFIVSQTNPHVIPFVTRKDLSGSGVFNSTRDFAFSTIRAQSKHLIDLVRNNMPLRAVRARSTRRRASSTRTIAATSTSIRK